MESKDWLNLVFSGLLATVVSAGITWFIAGRQYRKQQKLTLFGRLMSQRSRPLPPSFFEALNEVPATFADDKSVQIAWRTMLHDGQGNDSENLVALLRAAGVAVGADLSDITNSELLRPFVASVLNT